MKQLLAVAMLILMSAVPSAQQQPAPAPVPAPAAPARIAPGEPAPTPPAPNLRFDVVITDEGGGGPSTRKNISVIARANNQTASVRSTGQLNASHPISVASRQQGIAIGLNVDVRGYVENGKIPARVTVDYQPYWPEAKSLPSSVRAQVDMVFDDGRRTLISQAADPLSDRRTTIEVTVTVMN
jgi:hypothetical protein